MNNHWQPEDKLVGKVDELAASLHATTDVLSTADRMLGHYRDLNREQDAEISRVSKLNLISMHGTAYNRLKPLTTIQTQKSCICPVSFCYWLLQMVPNRFF